MSLKPSSKIRAVFLPLFFSLLWHALVIFLFVWLQTADNDWLWSGGRDGKAGGTDGVIVVALQSPSPALRLPSPVEGEGEKISKPKSTQAPPPSPLAGRVLRQREEGKRSAGEGNSTTPAGGVGSGLDATGTVSDTAPSMLALIRKKIAAKKKYPTAAYVKGIEGNVTVQFQINADGSLAFVNVITSSGSPILDAAAIQAVHKAAPLPYLAGAITLMLQYEINN